jgi:anaerobic magnesium-protoporphyrin IX monomethyl ester cyclase
MVIERRSICDIMYSDTNLDVILLQPPLYKPIFPDEQDEVFNQYQRIVYGRNALMNDLGTEPNHGLLQLAAILRGHGAAVDVLDFHVLDIWLRRHGRIITDDDYYHVLRMKRATLFGISSKIVGANRAFRIARIVRELWPASRIVMGGVHPTFDADTILETVPCVDVVARGEADMIIEDLWRWARGKTDLASIPGISYRGHDGQVVSSEKSLAPIDLDALPSPAYDLVARETDPLVPRILTARGCTLRCVFCASAALFGYKFNSRQAERVVDQIEAVCRDFGLEYICMGDLTFMAHKETGIAICEKLIRRQLGIHWSTQTTIGRIDREAAELMAAAGCEQLGFGVESGSQLIIEENNKNIAIEKAEEQFRIVKAAGISVQTYWVFGLPGETYFTAMASIDVMRRWIREELIDAVHITVAVPYPGTPLFENPEAYGIRIVDDNYDNYWTGSASLGIGYPVIESEHLTRGEVQMFWRLAHASAAAEFDRRFQTMDGSLHYIPQAADPEMTLASVLMPSARDPFPTVDQAGGTARTHIEIKKTRQRLRLGSETVA